MKNPQRRRDLIKPPTAGGTTRADREWDRFLSVCVPMAGGGWRDPNEPVLRRGVTAEQWNSLLATGAKD